MLFSHWVSLYVCVIFHLMCSIFCRHRNWFVQYLWSMWARKTFLSRHRWTAIGINFPVMRACYIVQSTTWSITGLYRAPVAVTRAIILKKEYYVSPFIYRSSLCERMCSLHAKCCFIPLVIGNSAQYDSDSITPALVALMQAVCIYLNKSLQT